MLKKLSSHNKRIAYSFFLSKIDADYPFTFIDIGAMGGIPSKWQSIQNSINIIAFEPDETEFSKLMGNNSNLKYFNCVLFKEPREVTYYITKGKGKSSILKPNMDILSQYEDSDRFNILRKEIIPAERVNSLDNIFKNNLLKDVDFIKIDTQGSELFILEGAEKMVIPNLFGAQIEVEFIEMYEKQPLFRDIDRFMDSKGFSLIDIRRHYWKRKKYYQYKGKGQLIFGDALYFKKIDFLLRELKTLNNLIFTKSKILKSVLICLLYHMFDYAASIAEVSLKTKYFTENEYYDTVKQIKQSAKSGIFSGLCLNRTIYNTLENILKKFEPFSYLGWADSDSKIGNIADSSDII